MAEDFFMFRCKTVTCCEFAVWKALPSLVASRGRLFAAVESFVWSVSYCIQYNLVKGGQAVT